MWTDPIVGEIRKLRDSYAAEHDYDIDAIFDDIVKRQAQGKREVVALPPRKPSPGPDAA